MDLYLSSTVTITLTFVAGKGGEFASRKKIGHALISISNRMLIFKKGSVI